MGNKQRIVNDILPLMLDDKYTTFVDLFCGSCSVIQKVPLTYHRIANDKNKYLIEMWKSIVEDKEFPLEIPKDLYSDVRDCWHGRNNRYEDDYIGWIGFMASFNGRFFVINMNWHISTQRTEAIIYLDKAFKELEEE